MVELKNDGVRLATVRAAVLTEVVPSAILILSSGALAVGTNALKLMIAISRIPIALVVRHAWATPRLPFSGISISDAELVRRLRHPASAAASLIGRERITDNVREGHFSDRDPYEGLLSLIRTQFVGCLPQVAVHTAHFALGDLELDG